MIQFEILIQFRLLYLANSFQIKLVLRRKIFQAFNAPKQPWSLGDINKGLQIAKKLVANVIKTDPSMKLFTEIKIKLNNCLSGEGTVLK